VRVLLIAYDFPPVPSPQSLRWAYLVRELALMGHEVHVLAPDVPGYGAGGLPEIPESVRVHRVYPGPMAGMLTSRTQRRQARCAAAESSSPAPAQAPVEPAVVSAPVPVPVLNWKGKVRHAVLGAPRRAMQLARRLLGLRPFGRGLNWKGELAERIKRFMSLWMFPDSRAEWMPWARRRLDQLLEQVKPDVVITSHEPANSIELGMHAKSRGFRWIADLGDPVLAPYTPKRWRRRAGELERRLCEQADIVSVTSRAAADILHARHGLPLGRCLLLTQGFDARFTAAPDEHGDICFDPQRLELLYTGSFYSFRRIDALLHAVLATDGVRLNVATIVAPAELVRAAHDHPERVRLLGFLSHRRALALQRRSDVLVNLANDDPVQVPGKLYEYLGAGVPILHISANADDATARLLAENGVGVFETDEPAALAARLAALVQAKREGRLPRAQRSPGQLSDYCWQSLAARLSAHLAPAD
jgi:hypothetical protein